MTSEAFGNFQVVATLGKGGMGEVLLGQHQRIARRAAIKVLSPELTKDPDAVKRFFTEARATSLIHHPGIIEVFDCDTDAAGRAYIVMEYLQGETLAARIARCERLPWPLACDIARQIAEAVGAAHGRGIIHRDLKPENVFLVDPSPAAPTSSEPTVKVLDFGVAKLVSHEARDDDWSQSLTRDGMLLGTPRYISPEQCRGAAHVDHRTDIYALGCVLYEMLSGEVIFPVDQLDMLLAAHMFRPPPSAKEAISDLPDWLDDLLGRMLAKQPEERPSTMAEVAQALGGPVRKISEPDDLRGDPGTWGGGSPSMTMLLPATGEDAVTGAGLWRRARLLRIAVVAFAVAVLAVVVASRQSDRAPADDFGAKADTPPAQPAAPPAHARAVGAGTSVAAVAPVAAGAAGAAGAGDPKEVVPATQQRPAVTAERASVTEERPRAAAHHRARTNPTPDPTTSKGQSARRKAPLDGDGIVDL